MMGVGVKRALGLYRSCAPRQRNAESTRFSAEYSEGAIGGGSSSRRVRASASDCIESVSAPPIAEHVVSKNTNELKTGSPGRFGLDVSTLDWPMGVKILGHEHAGSA